MYFLCKKRGVHTLALPVLTYSQTASSSNLSVQLIVAAAAAAGPGAQIQMLLPFFSFSLVARVAYMCLSACCDHGLFCCNYIWNTAKDHASFVHNCIIFLSDKNVRKKDLEMGASAS